MNDLTIMMDLRDPEYDPAKASDIVAILASLDPRDLSPGCSSADLSELNNAKNAAKDNADAVVATQANFISAKTDELNALVLLIQALNGQISAAGGTTNDPGITITPEPIVAIEGRTCSDTGWSGSLARLVLMNDSQETQIPLRLTSLTTFSPSSMIR